MAMVKAQIVSCVSDVSMQEKIESTAAEFSADLNRLTTWEALLGYADLAQANAILVQVSEFCPQTSELMDTLRERAAGVPVIVLLDTPSSATAVRFCRYGAFECLDTSSAIDQFVSVIEASFATTATLRKARAAESAEPWRRLLVGQSAPMEQTTRIIRLIAARRCTVLITGETGTGKEMAAKAIHMASNRARRPMVCVNCSAIPENLIEAELFGHVKGAFTGAMNHRIGRFEQANGGTLFLDEIADLPFELQSKLLRALQEKEIQRLGSSETIKVDVRVIAATNADLHARVQQGRFREDLFYRLNVVPIHLAPLRTRVSDIPILVEHFIQKICEAEGIATKTVSPEALKILSGYAWPGNVRQLENAVEHAVVMSGDRECLYGSDFKLPTDARAARSLAAAVSTASLNTEAHETQIPDDGLNFTETLRQFERGILQEAMSRAQGNKTLAADILRLPRTTLIHKLRILHEAA
jgi:DNA-binding NtrC family response regulator